MSIIEYKGHTLVPHVWLSRAYVKPVFVAEAPKGTCFLFKEIGSTIDKPGKSCHAIFELDVPIAGQRDCARQR
ncbi:MAG: hypothetical protein ACREIA_11635 [Opitutaceae bacterium]